MDRRDNLLWEDNLLWTTVVSHKNIWPCWNRLFPGGLARPMASWRQKCDSWSRFEMNRCYLPASPKEAHISLWMVGIPLNWSQPTSKGVASKQVTMIPGTNGIDRAKHCSFVWILRNVHACQRFDEFWWSWMIITGMPKIIFEIGERIDWRILQVIKISFQSI
jgi:hypothetical protein